MNLHRKNPILVLLAGMFFCSVYTAGCGGKLPESPESSAKSATKVKIGENVWTVELAMTREVRYVGLSGRGELADTAGMLFIYPEPIMLNFCMSGCLIPIDIVFIGANLRVVNTYAMQVEPGGRGVANYSSGLPAQYALELSGGTVKKCGIANGDAVELFGVPGVAKAELVTAE